MLPWCSGLLAGLFSGILVHAQQYRNDTLAPVTHVAAAMDYLPMLSQQSLAGTRYRLEWALPVKVPVALLDTLQGGLRLHSVNTKAGNLSLNLLGSTGRSYRLKPLLYAPTRVLPDIYQGSVVSDFAADLGSAQHPYAPLTVGILQQAAGLPDYPVQLIYVPGQKALAGFPERLVNRLYFLQTVPPAALTDTSFSWVSTERMLALAEQDNRYRPDALAYLKYRLLDMLLGVNTRDEQGWRWLAQHAGGHTRYLPVPQGYESAYARYDGRMLTLARIVAPMGHLVSFDRQMPEPRKLNERALHLDRRLTAGLSENQWLEAARSIQATLTDEILQKAIAQLPPEIQAVNGRELLAKLKSRRMALVQYAQRYYDLLVRQIDVIASASNEQVRITGTEGKGIHIRMFALDSNGTAAIQPHFDRRFQPDATREVNLYGVGGNDQFLVEGNLHKKIRLRIIGGPQKDSLRNTAQTGNIDVYDNNFNRYAYNNHSRFHLSDDGDVHQYDFDAFAFNKKGLSPMLFYNNNDRIYAGIAYKYIRRGWRKTPFAQQHKAYLNYSLWQGGVSTGYEGIFNQVIGKWNGIVSAEYDAIRWNNFFGIGNESPPQVLDNDYHRVRSEVVNADAGLFRPLGKHHSLGLSARFQSIRIRPDTERFIGKTMATDDPLLFRTHSFGGGRVTYGFVRVNDPLVPTRGIVFNGSAAYMRNLKQTQREVRTYAANMQGHVPLGKRWVYSIGGGFQTVSGQPEFYQLASIGGTATLRGFRRERFWGQTAAYNQHELMYVVPFRSYFFNGPVGIYGLFDAGRIWQPGEVSNTIHTGYGLGLMLAPFNRVRLEVAYARSSERGMVHIGYRGNLF